jgi:hypothetical protein
MKIIMLVAFLASVVHGWRVLDMSGTSFDNMDSLERKLLSLKYPEDWIAIVAFPMVVLALGSLPASVLAPGALLGYSGYGIYKSFKP